MIVFSPRWGRIFIAALLVIQITALSSVMADEPRSITLKTAVETALTQRPELQIFSKDMLAAKARITRSAALPNPELGMETSSLGDEDSLTLSQTFEFASKRDARVKAAAAEIPLHENERARARLDIINEVSQAFVAMLGAQEKRILVQDAHKIASRLAKTITERVAEGAISPIEEARAKASLAGALTDLSRAERELVDAHLALASAMGSHEPGFTTVTGRIPAEPILPEKKALLAAATSSPDLARWKLERDRRAARVESELAARIPDIAFSGKLSHDKDTDETALIIGMSVPLPLFNRNQGEINEARAELEKIPYVVRSEELRMTSEIERRHATLRALAAEIGIVRDQQLSFAREAFDAISEGYHLGKFGYLDVLDASRELTGAKLRHLELLITFESEITAINRLIATGNARLEGDSI